jgi:hypothetical protein
MLLPALAIVAGLLVGLTFRSPHRHAAPPHVRGWPILGAGLVAQVGAELVLAGILVPVSYALLVVFAARNLHLVGMPIVALGLALNAIVIAANGAMPVRADAVEAAGIADAAELAATDVDLGPKREIEEPDDRLTLLADIVPISPLRQVVSFGDLVLHIGVADVVAHVVRRRRRRSDGAAAWTAADDVAVAHLLASEQSRIHQRATAW